MCVGLVEDFGFLVGTPGSGVGSLDDLAARADAGSSQAL
jgi:hypothetical protein